MERRGATKTVLILTIITLTCLTAFKSKDKSTISEGLKGAKNKKELSGVVYNALKRHDFNLMQAFIPGTDEVELINKKVSYQHKNNESIKAELQKSFHHIIESGIDKNINWSLVELVDQQIEDGNEISLIRLELEDHRGHKLTVNIKLIEIEDRWYITELV
ncbi:hypothetical protein RCC89_00560 [Cytophagaceae bacterium ABcell3]|nr:hypothetical protein RCC89_00560 [Cytophagaceae bacterium ABcell3]